MRQLLHFKCLCELSGYFKRKHWFKIYIKTIFLNKQLKMFEKEILQHGQVLFLSQDVLLCQKNHPFFQSKIGQNYFNPFPHIDAFWRLCSRQIFENIVTKEEIAQNVHFSFCHNVFSTFCHRLSIQIWRFSIFWQNTFKVVCCRIVVWGKGVKIMEKNMSHTTTWTWR